MRPLAAMVVRLELISAIDGPWSGKESEMSAAANFMCFCSNSLALELLAQLVEGNDNRRYEGKGNVHEGAIAFIVIEMYT